MLRSIALLLVSAVVSSGASQALAAESPAGTRPPMPLEPIRPNAYGPGVNADATGAPHTYRTQDGEDVGIFNKGVERDAYGAGVHMDELGRPVHDSTP